MRALDVLINGLVRPLGLELRAELGGGRRAGRPVAEDELVGLHASQLHVDFALLRWLLRDAVEHELLDRYGFPAREPV